MANPLFWFEKTENRLFRRKLLLSSSLNWTNIRTPFEIFTKCPQNQTRCSVNKWPATMTWKPNPTRTQLRAIRPITPNNHPPLFVFINYLKYLWKVLTFVILTVFVPSRPSQIKFVRAVTMNSFSSKFLDLRRSLFDWWWKGERSVEEWGVRIDKKGRRRGKRKGRKGKEVKISKEIEDWKERIKKKNREMKENYRWEKEKGNKIFFFSEN